MNNHIYLRQKNHAIISSGYGPTFNFLDRQDSKPFNERK